METRVGKFRMGGYEHCLETGNVLLLIDRSDCTQ
jgi:hypothetical protein